MSLGIRCGRVDLGFELLAISRDESCTHNNKREKQASKFQTVVTSGGGERAHGVPDCWWRFVCRALWQVPGCLRFCYSLHQRGNVRDQTDASCLCVNHMCTPVPAHTFTCLCGAHHATYSHTHTHANIPAALLSGPRSVSKAFGLAPLPLGCLGSPEPRVWCTSNL